MGTMKAVISVAILVQCILLCTAAPTAPKPGKDPPWCAYINAEAQCSNKKLWTQCANLCSFAIECGKPAPLPRGYVIGDGNKYNDRISFTCDTGYQVDGEAEAVCLITGNWSVQTPQCQRIDCGELQAPENGSIQGAGHIYKDRITFSCNAGFELHGDDEAQCLATGKWSVEIPQCQRKDCGELRMPQHGSVIGFGHMYNDRIRFACDTGYELDGDDEVVCLETGKWSSSKTPQCQRIGCGELQAPGNGSVIGDGHQYNDRIKFACNKGYEIQGEADALCLETGDWSVETPHCQKVDPGWCAFMNDTSDRQCSNPVILEHCTVLCDTGEDPQWCSYVDATDQCLNSTIASQCKHLCVVAQWNLLISTSPDPEWCGYLDITNCNMATGKHCKTLCATEAKPKNGESCVANDGIPAVCGYHGQHYIWCWTSENNWDRVPSACLWD